MSIEELPVHVGKMARIRADFMAHWIADVLPTLRGLTLNEITRLQIEHWKEWVKTEKRLTS